MIFILLLKVVWKDSNLRVDNVPIGPTASKIVPILIFLLKMFPIQMTLYESPITLYWMCTLHKGNFESDTWNGIQFLYYSCITYTYCEINASQLDHSYHTSSIGIWAACAYWSKWQVKHQLARLVLKWVSACEGKF